MLEDTMIAYCGLDCSRCSAAHDGKEPCHGCASPDGCKPEFCRSLCPIKLCEKRIQNHYRLCSECPDYPCPLTRQHDQDCREQYATKESPYENLMKIRQVGVQRFLKEEHDKWTCVECGGMIRAQDGVCSGCGRTYTL